MIGSIIFLSIVAIASTSFLNCVIWEDHSKDRKLLSPYPFIISYSILAVIIVSWGFFTISEKEFLIKYEEGYKQGQVDYMNGDIKYKAVPTTQVNYEKLENVGK